jgi:hypothetical protein
MNGDAQRHDTSSQRGAAVMACMTEPRSEHSSLGVASLLLSFFPAVLLVGIYWLVLFLISKQPPGADD